eukprot:TRINITY_DN39724_c0_g1_i1.p1 TRINITY_DN39724_c0_g1~~TRINITY_DN39724_c0_g1_i1.p1  ORF type:complete len:1898 (+),score=373.96 TRINITY_DN39724_c0_g1_i1:40-5694(+)
MSHGEEDDTFAPPPRQSTGRGRRPAAHTQEDDLHASGMFSERSSLRGGTATSTAHSQPVGDMFTSGLNLSFGFSPMQLEKIDLRGNHKPGPNRDGSGLSEHAIESLVLSAVAERVTRKKMLGVEDNPILHLDLRGNRLNAAFGWKLIKAMKQQYLSLEFCNGVPLRALKAGSIDTLNLSPFYSHVGMPWPQNSKEAAMEFANRAMYGIEVVGAIFLAHFLRLNTSLTSLNFRLNAVEKDGAKALAQSLLGNAQTALRTVNTMGQAKNKPGVDFAHFKMGQLTVVDLSKRQMDDDDFVFLEEWLRRYNTVTDLNISWNLMSRDGIRKLARYIKETTVLVKLSCCGLPVTQEGSALLARAVIENQSLQQVALPLGPCSDDSERQEMLRQFGLGLASHPTIQKFASTRTPNLEYANLAEARENKVRAYPPVQSGGWPRTQMAAYMWFLVAVKPDLEKLTMGPNGKPKTEYPKEACAGAMPELIPATLGILHDAGRSLLEVSIALPHNYSLRAMELMRVLTMCGNMRSLKLLGYASVAMKESQLPTEWATLGSAPRWLFEDKLQKRRTHWQALHGLLAALPRLEQFNEFHLGDISAREQPEHTCLLLMQCLEGVATDLVAVQGSGEAVLKATLRAEADVDAFCDVLRLLSRTPVLLDLHFSDKRMEVVKQQQARLVPHLSGHAVEGIPRFTHAVSLRNNVVSDALLKGLGCHAPLREFGYENISHTLQALFVAMCGNDKPLPVERIRIEPKWLQSRIPRKRFRLKREHSWLDGIQAALIRSERFVELDSAGTTFSRSEIETMSPAQFADALTGISLDDPFPPEMEKIDPQMQYLCFPSRRAFERPPPADPHEPQPGVFVSLPMDEEGRSQRLRCVSFVMCGLRHHLQQEARPDEWPEFSTPLWLGRGSRLRFVRPGDEYDVAADEADDDEGYDPENPVPARYHWRPDLRLGTASASAHISEALQPDEPTFADNLLHQSLQSLLTEDSPVQELDLRGNGLTRDDANLLLDLVYQHKSLLRLNMIPVLEAEAATCQSLVIDGTGIKEPEKPKVSDDPYGDDEDEEDPTDEAYCREAFQAEFVRMDEGDGHIFFNLVAPNTFQELRSVTLRKLEIPHESTLAHITDALLNLRTVEQLHLSDLRLSSRGASLLLQAVAELAPRLASLNGLPLARLLQLKDQSEGGMHDLPANVEWNDFTLGAMARLGLWPVAAFKPAGQGGGGELQLQGNSFTDVGLRGLCVMLRHFGQGATRGGPGALNLTKIDLSGNLQISDATVADLCHTLKTPSMGNGLRGGLRELSLRGCMRLKTRSAFELLNFVQHVREAAREAGAIGNTLQIVNGVDLEALQAAGGRTTAVATSGRIAGPPMLLRSIVDPSQAKHARAALGLKTGRSNLASMSECDTHFLAGVLQQFQNIPYCHMHIVIPASLLEETRESGESPEPWGRPMEQAGLPCSNDSPFPPPVAGGRSTAVAARLQAHIDSACRFFEACPILAELRVSMVPAVPGCEDLLFGGGQEVLVTSGGSTGSGASAMQCFNEAKKRLQERAAKKRKRQSQGMPPPKALYVNNINRQRLHCCFRTLYGKDDAELMHDDVMPPGQSGSIISLPSEVDVSQLFGVATSVDLQHLDLSPAHIAKLPELTEMPVLTHVNLNHNHLGDVGIELLFRALVDAGSSIEHVAVAANDVGDEGAAIIAASLGSLPRLTSLELCDNFIQERGSIALAESIGGVAPVEDVDGEEAVSNGPLPVLSVDLRGNRSRELGARRWAEVIVNHPDLKFLCMAENELGFLTKEYFLDLVCAAVSSASLSVLDLQENFPMGPPPTDVVEELLTELPTGEFDPDEVQKAVFIRRHRSGGSGEKKGRQPQQASSGGAHGSQRHSHSPSVHQQSPAP